MTLRREDLTPQWCEHYARKLRPVGTFEPLTEADRRASLARTLAEHPGGDLWLFGYGSLMWNPLVYFQERQAARLFGFHRAYCIWMYWGRGTYDVPGLMLGLDRGGSCRGVAFRLAEKTLQEELTLIWRRELISGVYRPCWVKAHTAVGSVRAITFVTDRHHPTYASGLSQEEVAASITRARGVLGSSRDYLENTTAHLAEIGIRDRYLQSVRARVQALAANASGGSVDPPVNPGSAGSC